MSERTLDSHLVDALAAAEDDEVRYHIRAAMQRRVVEQETPDGPISA